jgi:hypothetical protein
LDTSTIGEDGIWEERTIVKAVCHPKYFSMTEENDICVLKINKPSTKQACRSPQFATPRCRTFRVQTGSRRAYL